jgi:hypothetical protein
MCNFKPQVILNIDEVWDIKRRMFEILARTEAPVGLLRTDRASARHARAGAIPARP